MWQLNRQHLTAWRRSGARAPTRGISASAPAIATRCFCPPLSVATGRSAKSSRPTRASESATTACTMAGDRRYLRANQAVLSIKRARNSLLTS
jgi:hypothetical protein